MKIWLPMDAATRMQSDAKSFSPLETGGVLAGYWSSCGNEAVVTDVFFAGPESKRASTFYRPDYAHDQKMVGELHDSSKGKLTYLGDWHSHPGSSPKPSTKDKRALRNIAKFEENYVDYPIMVILGQKEKNTDWDFEACCLTTKKALLGWTVCSYTYPEILIYH